LIHELREYVIAPGKTAALHRRFQEITCPLFKKHGIHIIGFWNVVIGDTPKLIYLCAFQDLAHRERAWDAFLNDPEWIQAREASEKDGALTTRITSMILQPTAYSPLQ
jgi:hypothetical protein